MEDGRKVAIGLGIVTSLAGLIYAATRKVEAAPPVPPEITETFFSSPSDGYTEHWEDHPIPYSTVHNAYSSRYVNHIRTAAFIGQLVDKWGYLISRGYLFFNTSFLAGYTITGAILSLFGKRDFSDTDFDIVIQSGMPGYPRDPPIKADYYHGHYSGNGGSLSTKGFKTAQYNDIVLNEAGINMINREGWTRFCLRSAREISAVAPIGDEFVEIYTNEQGVGYIPKLVVRFIPPI